MMLLVGIMAEAKPLTLDFFKDKPKSLTKDFYISQFLDQGCSDKDAALLFPQIKNLNTKLFKKFARHIDSMKRKAYCQNLKGKQFIGRSADCVQLGLSLYKSTKLSPSSIEKITAEVTRKNPKLAAQYYAISTKKFSNLIKLPPALIVKTFNNVGGAFRKKHYDYALEKKLIAKLVQEKGFNLSLEKIIRGNFPKLQKSVLDINASLLSAESNFLLALNALTFSQKDLALNYLRVSEKKAPYIFEKNKALFWRYLLNNDTTILEELRNSHEINIYTLYAYQKAGKFPQNIIHTIKTTTDKNPINIRDPFAWIKFKKDVKGMKFKDLETRKSWIMQYSSAEMAPHISRLLYRFKDNQHYFLTPYAKYLQKQPIERQILIYALARQESHFIPTEVSYSYALGMMQFMPFVAKDIAQKEKMKDFTYEVMFDPQTAYHFANIHLDFLEKSVRHPLFIAYAYNAGIGFTKRQILSKDYFKKGNYEPFWSMEMVPNAQARKYGKRVLSNYIIYAKYLGLDMSLDTLLKTIK